ncbi:MAG: gliding motility-associated C-terminal domain-containing protein [Bacteroidetes bacterium]|nr:gliding motility-associated C-terminal domain-containing protein [Bacteroidota bacterium]
MKQLLLIIALFTTSFISKAQCFEIESILVDACDGSNEGKNEMVTFKVGSTALNTANLTVAWPNNSWLGVCQNAGTAADIATVNATITKCGYLKEPVGGVLPANSRVLLVTSTAWNPLAQSFVNLSDTLIVIFQCAGNTSGHFANYGTGLRTLTMAFTTPTSCTDAVTYDRSLLLTQALTVGAQDGGAVEYDPAGNPTYVNHGCQAPYIPLSVNAGPDQSICYNAHSVLTATTNGIYNGLNWSGGTGTFSNPTALTTTYTPGAGETGPVKLYCSLTRSCTASTTTVKDSVMINVIALPQAGISASNGYSLCPGATSVLSYSITNAAVASTVNPTWSSPTSTLSTYTVSAPTGTTSNTYTLNLANSCGTFTQSFTVYALSNPSVTLAAHTYTACAGSTVAISASGSPANYSWNNPAGATTATVSLTASTSTTGVVTTTNSCGSASDTYSLVVTPIPTVTVSPTSLSLCSGQSGTLTASSNISSFNWSTGATTNTISVNTSGVKTVTVSNACGTATASVSVTVTSLPTLSISSTQSLICGAQTATLSLSGSTGTYTWNTGAGTSSITANTGGIYSASVTTSCGTASDSYTLAALPVPTVSITTPSVSLCSGQSATLTAVSNASTYAWSNSATSGSISVNNAGVSTVTVSNACGSASASATVTVNNTPTLSISSTQSVICSGQSATLTLNGSTGTYTWSTGSGSTSITANTAGVYTATVTSSCGNASAAYTLAVLPSPTVSISTPSLTLCNGQSETLTAVTNATAVAWSTGATTNTVLVNTAGIETVSVTNQCGTATASVNISTSQTPTLNLAASSLSLCPGQTATLTVSGGSAPYAWSGSSSTGNSITGGAGSYTVSNTNACGTGTASITITQTTLNAAFTVNPSSGVKPLLVGFNNTSTGATTYAWGFDNGHSSTAQNPNAETYINSGTYTVVLLVSNGTCTATATETVTVLEEEPYLIIPNVFTPNQDSVNDMFHVSALNIKDFNCKIYNRWGLLLYTMEEINSGWDGKINGHDASEGTYFYIIEAKDIFDKDQNKKGTFLLIR